MSKTISKKTMESLRRTVNVSDNVIVGYLRLFDKEDEDRADKCFFIKTENVLIRDSLKNIKAALEDSFTIKALDGFVSDWEKSLIITKDLNDDTAFHVYRIDRLIRCEPLYEGEPIFAELRETFHRKVCLNYMRRSFTVRVEDITQVGKNLDLKAKWRKYEYFRTVVPERDGGVHYSVFLLPERLVEPWNEAHDYELYLSEKKQWCVSHQGDFAFRFMIDKIDYDAESLIREDMEVAEFADDGSRLLTMKNEKVNVVDFKRGRDL